jgi:hypothetical protein
MSSYIEEWAGLIVLSLPELKVGDDKEEIPLQIQHFLNISQHR